MGVEKYIVTDPSKPVTVSYVPYKLITQIFSVRITNKSTMMINQKVSCIALCALLQLANAASDKPYQGAPKRNGENHHSWSNRRVPGQVQPNPQELPLALYVTGCNERQYGDMNGLYVRVRKDRIRALCPGQWAPDHEMRSHDYYYMSVKNQRGNNGDPIPHYYITALDAENWVRKRREYFWMLYSTGEWGFTGEGAEAKMSLRRSAVPEHRIKSKTEYRAQDLLPIPSDFNAGGSGANVQSLSVQSLDTMPLPELQNLSTDINTYMEGRVTCPEVDNFLTQVQSSVGKKMLALMSDPGVMAKLMAMMGAGPKGPPPSGPGYKSK